MKRGIDNIAYDILNDWSDNLAKDIPSVVKPYLKTMTQLISVDEMYGYDSADYIVKMFIYNAQEIYTTPKAEQYLDELKALVEWKEDDLFEDSGDEEE